MEKGEQVAVVEKKNSKSVAKEARPGGIRMSEMKIWDKVKTPPSEALKGIKGGRLSGFTDIDPVWRFQIMTETFGPVGIGWVYELLESSEARIGDEVCIFQDVRLKYKHDGEWSEWIPGTGGSKLATQEKNGIHVSDECYKMALTDALSVAMKAIGVGADVYQGKLSHKGSNGAASDSKYSAPQSDDKPPWVLDTPCPQCGGELNKSKFEGTYAYCKDKACGFKVAKKSDLEDPKGNTLAEAVGRIYEAEKEFKKIGAEDAYKELLNEFKLDKVEDIDDEGVATKLLLRISTVFTLAKKAAIIEGKK